MIQKNKQKHSENFERLEIGRVIFLNKKKITINKAMNKTSFFLISIHPYTYKENKHIYIYI